MDDELVLIRVISTQIWQLGQEIWAQSEPLLAELELTPTLAELVWALDPNTGTRTMRELAELLHCDASNITFLADRLEERGLARREGSATDRRVKLLSLTQAGRAQRDRLVREVIVQTPLARLTHAEKQRLHDLLAKAIAVPRGASG